MLFGYKLYDVVKPGPDYSHTHAHTKDKLSVKHLYVIARDSEHSSGCILLYVVLCDSEGCVLKCVMVNTTQAVN